MSLAPEQQQQLQKLLDRVRQNVPYMLGYPSNQVYDYSELFDFLGYSMNNIGDPFAEAYPKVTCHQEERELVEWYAQLCGLPKDQVWGYVTNGGTEGNMYGLYVARELHPDGICYFSEAAHYSVPKILRLQHTRNIMIRARQDGSMDTSDLYESLKINRDKPPIIFVTAGTTMTGACDNLREIKDILKSLAIHNYHIHVDAALSGMILPFVDSNSEWNFTHGIHSLAVSGHKFLGAPIPCGIVLCRKSLVDRIARSIEYVGAMDTTISGSRSAFSVLMLWYRLHTLGVEGMRNIARRGLQLADYLIEKLQAHGVPAWRHPDSITVVMPKPTAGFLDKWCVASQRDIMHVITLPPCSEQLLDQLIVDYLANQQPHKLLP